MDDASFDDPAGLARLVTFAQGRRLVALTGAGCSTDSGIPDYRGKGRPTSGRGPIEHHAFTQRPEVRQRYWARATLGWERFSGAAPNDAHRALAELERQGLLTGVITQNVDRLHLLGGSRNVVELHGALADVTCLGCGQRGTRADVHRRLLAANPGFAATHAALAPDGDSELHEEEVASFRVVPCLACGGALKPDVVFFGGNVAPAVLEGAWALFDAADALLVVGSSLAVYSGMRFVLRARQRNVPVAIVNRGPTRADTFELDARVFGGAGPALRALVERAATSR